MKFFPVVVADLDYRMMYQNDQHNHIFERTLIDNTTIYQLQRRREAVYFITWFVE